MKTIKKLLSFVLPVLILVAVFSCKKENGGSSVNSDEAAAARMVGTYKGTIDITSQDYFNAIIIVTKESGNKVKVAAKTGEAYSNVTTKIFTIKAISGSEDAGSIIPEGTVVYGHSDGTLKVTTRATASGDVAYDFRGTKQ
ncbi:MAG: hypothetical protein V4456_21710 [Bacteroidota bacterium]